MRQCDGGCKHTSGDGVSTAAGVPRDKPVHSVNAVIHILRIAGPVDSINVGGCAVLGTILGALRSMQRELQPQKLVSKGLLLHMLLAGLMQVWHVVAHTIVRLDASFSMSAAHQHL